MMVYLIFNLFDAISINIKRHLKRATMRWWRLQVSKWLRKTIECLITIPWRAEILSLIKKANTHCIKEVANGRIMCCFRSCERMSWIMAIGGWCNDVGLLLDHQCKTSWNITIIYQSGTIGLCGVMSFKHHTLRDTH